MARNVDNIYVELFENLKIPERLEPENIAAMLAEKTAAVSSGKAPAEVVKTSDEKISRNITVTSNKRLTSTAFRTIASFAACAALAFGVAGYMGVFDKELPSEPPKVGAQYAENYDDLHKTFEEYYVGSEDKKTLDSAIADIEHSYNDNENENETGPDSAAVTSKPEPEKEAPAQSVTEPAEAGIPEHVAPAPAEDPTPEVEEIETPDLGASDPAREEIKLPETKAKSIDGEVVFGDGFMAEQNDGVLRIYSTGGGNVELTESIIPAIVPGAEKTLAGFYASGSKLTVVYSVATSSNYPYDPTVNGMLDSLYGVQPSASGYSVEVCVYNVFGGRPMLENDFTQDGSLVDMTYSNGNLYTVTAYNDYRNAPIVGVEDLQSYVPGYTVNGVRNYIEPQNIMIPDYISTTDYTVISGVTSDGAVSVQAVLGYEGRVVLTNGAVYLFGYDSTPAGDVTSAKVFWLVDGQVVYAGYKDIDGVALSGDGISLFGNAIAVTSVSDSPDGSGYVTTLTIYDSTLEKVSWAYFQGVALTTVKRVGDSLYFSGQGENYAIDLSDPEHPMRMDGTAPVNDPAEGLVEFDGGYVTLTLDDGGELILSKLSKDPGGSLMLNYSTVLCESGGRSKALENNGLLFVSGSVVGVPYGFFDGLDYTFRYALYRAGSNGFEPAGEIEIHEVDEAFEFGKAYLNGGYLYILSEGRVYCAATKDGLSLSGTANLIQSAYSGHN